MPRPRNAKAGTLLIGRWTSRERAPIHDPFRSHKARPQRLPSRRKRPAVPAWLGGYLHRRQLGYRQGNSEQVRGCRRTSMCPRQQRESLKSDFFLIVVRRPAIRSWRWRGPREPWHPAVRHDTATRHVCPPRRTPGAARFGHPRSGEIWTPSFSPAFPHRETTTRTPVGIASGSEQR